MVINPAHVMELWYQPFGQETSGVSRMETLASWVGDTPKDGTEAQHSPCPVQIPNLAAPSWCFINLE